MDMPFKAPIRSIEKRSLSKRQKILHLKDLFLYGVLEVLVL